MPNKGRTHTEVKQEINDTKRKITTKKQTGDMADFKESAKTETGDQSR